MASIYDWSATAASNATVGSINWAEGQAPSTINNSARDTMADVAKWRDILGGAKISSGTDTIVLTSGLSLSAYAQGMMIAFEAGGTNTGAATLNIDSVGAKAVVKKHDVALAAGDIEAGQIVLVAYEATADNFQMLSQVASSDVGFADPMTTRGDIIVRNASNATARLAKGSANQVLSSDGTDVAYSAVTVSMLSGGTLTVGFAGTDHDLGTNASGTETLNHTNGNFQKGVNGGAHTLAPQTTTSTIVVQYTNNSSAGSLTTSGYTLVSGDSLTTTNGHDFMMYSTVLNSFKHLHITALQ